MRTDFPYFAELWQRLQATGDAGLVHAELIARYSEPHRAYHGLQHLEECLLAFDLAKADGSMKNPDAIEMALWFHDVIYDPQGTDNEEESADTANRLLSEADVLEHVVSEIARLILVTKTHVARPDDDSAWMVDIDLSILGQPTARFLEYEEQINREYAWVPRAFYQERRAEVLERFLQRLILYSTPFFYYRLEAAARENLRHALHHLRPYEGSDGQIA